LICSCSWIYYIISSNSNKTSNLPIYWWISYQLESFYDRNIRNWSTYIPLYIAIISVITVTETFLAYIKTFIVLIKIVVNINLKLCKTGKRTVDILASSILIQGNFDRLVTVSCKLNNLKPKINTTAAMKSTIK
jgi:hypothetical protein